MLKKLETKGFLYVEGWCDQHSSLVDSIDVKIWSCQYVIDS